MLFLDVLFIMPRINDLTRTVFIHITEMYLLLISVACCRSLHTAEDGAFNSSYKTDPPLTFKMILSIFLTFSNQNAFFRKSKDFYWNGMGPERADEYLVPHVEHQG